MARLIASSPKKKLDTVRVLKFRGPDDGRPTALVSGVDVDLATIYEQDANLQVS